MFLLFSLFFLVKVTVRNSVFTYCSTYLIRHTCWFKFSSFTWIIQKIDKYLLAKSLNVFPQNSTFFSKILMIKKIETKQIKTIWTRENICVWHIESIDTLDVMKNKTIITQKIISGKVVTHEKKLLHYSCKNFDEIWKIKELIHENI